MARIIVIDDDPLFANLVRQRLEQDGHDVVYNQGAYGALTAIRQSQPDVILIDVQMPDIEGSKLVELLRVRGVGSARILLMSSIDEGKLKDTARDFGAHGYLCKNWGVNEIAARIGGQEPRESGVRRASNGQAPGLAKHLIHHGIARQREK